MELQEKVLTNADWFLGMQQGWENLLRHSGAFFFPELAVDYGTSNIRVYVPGQGIVLEMPTLLAVERRTEQIVAVGEAANALRGREPIGISVQQPVEAGVFKHEQAAAALLRHCLSRLQPRRFSLGRRLWVALPSDVTPLEIRTVREVALAAGIARVVLLEEAVASALGAQIEAERTRSSVVVDIGAGTTDIAVVSGGELVQGRTLRRGSRALDQAILNYLRQTRGIETSAEAAERLKLELATLLDAPPAAQLEIRGRNLTTQLPEFFTVTRAEVRTAIEPVLQQLGEFIRTTLEQLPLKAALDLLDTGVVLCGGGALLPGLADWLADELRLGVWLADAPQHATIAGLGRLVEQKRPGQSARVFPKRHWRVRQTKTSFGHFGAVPNHVSPVAAEQELSVSGQ